MAGDIAYADKQRFKLFLDVCQARGRDSTGVAMIERSMDNYRGIKRVGPPSFLFDSKTYDETIDTGGVCSALLGHCRHKTVGDVSNQTAHPFDFPDQKIIGMHNGTLRSYYNLDTYASGKVDSEVMLGHLAINGPEDTFSKTEGAWAVVWWDGEAKTLNFIRNNERPLWFTWSADMTKIFWASETWMFGAIERPGERQGIDLWEGDEDTPKYVSLPVNELWRIKMDFKNLHNKRKSIFTMLPPKKIVSEVRSHSGNRQTSSHTSGRGAVVSTPSTTKDSREGFFNGRNNYGDWSQNPDTGRWEKNSGGEEVENPTRAKTPPLTLVSPGQTSGTSASTPSTSPTEKSGKPSKSSSASSTASTGSQNSEKNTSSRRPTLTVVGPKTSRRKDSEDSTPLSVGSGVSFRNVAGIDFITNNHNGKEYVQIEFEKATGGICCHCNSPIGDITEVDTIIDDQTFVCTSCTHEHESAVA